MLIEFLLALREKQICTAKQTLGKVFRNHSESLKRGTI
jgi:hypothetical protein